MLFGLQCCIRLKIAVTWLLVCLSTTFGFKNKNAILNYYGIPKYLDFNGNRYDLGFSTHPNDTYYKQEYIPKGQNTEHFDDLIFIDFLNDDKIPLNNAVQTQIATLKERKKTDAICNYQVLKNVNKKEYILDFLLSESTNDKVSIVEWNAYRYIIYSDNSGHTGVLLFGVSHRVYDDKIDGFLKSFSLFRTEKLKRLSEYHMPEIQLKDKK
jgi:hypothetical protein